MTSFIFLATKPVPTATQVFPDIEAKQVKRGTGGRSSFNGQIVTVFGAGGFVGRTLVNKLAKEGAQIVVPYRGDVSDVSKLKVSGDLGQILFTKFHLKDTESIHRAIKYSNIVVNLLGKDLETNNFSFNCVHKEGPKLISRICRQIGIKRLIHVSAMNVTPEPEKHLIRSQWLRSKYFGELAVREEFPEAIIIRPADIHGMDDNWSQSFCKWQRRQLKGLPLWNGGFGIFKRPVFLGDVALAIKNAITDDEAPGQTYQAVGPREYEMRNLVKYIQRIIEKTEENGFHVTNLKWHPFFRFRIFLFSNPKWLFKYPQISFEKLERENISDVLDPTLKTIEDLGVHLTFLEEKIEYNLFHWRKNSHYGSEVGEFPAVERPVFQ